MTFFGYESFASISYAPVEYYKNEKADDAVYSLTFNAKGAFDLLYQYEQFQNKQRFIVE